jgi:signal transduction histidine kinase
MSHELRTPLNAMIGYTEMVKEELEEEGRDELVADLDSSHEAAMRLFGMIEIESCTKAEVEAGQCQEQGTTVRLYLPARGPMDSMRLR